MGAALVKKEVNISLGPREKDVLKTQREEPLDLEENEIQREWPYENNWLKAPDYQAIIDKGQPWTDPDFKPDSTSLFIDGIQHQQANERKSKAIWNEYTWMRASEYFGSLDFCLYKTIEAEDVKQGNIDNCYLMAVLSALAERDLYNIELSEFSSN